ncbi:Fe-Mn family superoxide dismutase [Anaerocolumna sp. AGMB13020]|uniref:superoxide dismutase n=1 Tax=Anaerocolumna sp. AGMB13020 TaxID=3081750 RepID=UPI0029542A90|nr:Fe-Mn family superoxide dismutase [Anaerocolumna sp. AGMB13020]WOO36853.1 Fe-Mn family superoxide dismutase [Anaerocolumna sp. AGMB13020]
MEIVKVNFEYSDDVTVINREQFDVHMRLYEGYIKKINEIDALLQADTGIDEANSTYSEFRGIKRGEVFALNGVILHELYFENIGSLNNTPNEQVRRMLSRDYGSFDNWMAQFVATAKSSRGWAILCYDPRSDSFRNDSLDAHDYGNMSMSIPLLVLDMYEHAYFLQYADDKVEYINRFMENIDWQVVGERMELLQ